MKQPDATQKAVAGRLISYKTDATYNQDQDPTRAGVDTAHRKKFH